MSANTTSSCPSCQQPLSVYQGRCSRCGALAQGVDAEQAEGSGLELDTDRSWQQPPPVERKPTAPEVAAVRRTATATALKATVPAPVPVKVEPEPEPEVEWSPERVRRALRAGLVGLGGAGIVLGLQGALPAHFPPLMEMAVWRPALTGAPSDFFPVSAWALALLGWGALALAVAAGHLLARLARMPLDLGRTEAMALVLVPGVNLVGAPYVLGSLGRASGLRSWMTVKTGVAVGLHVLAQGLDALWVGSSSEPLLVAVMGARALSTAASGLVLWGLGRSLRSLAGARDAAPTTTAVKGWGSAVRRRRVKAPLVAAAWAVALGVTVLVLAAGSVWRAEARTCASGTRVERTGGAGGPQVSACVLPDGRRQGWTRTRAAEGQLLASGEYLEGERHGTFREWSEQGVLLEELTYARGLPNGPWKLFWPSGERALEQEYAEGLLEGANTTHFADGKPRHRKHYQRGVVHGRHARWFESGLVEVEGAFNQGRPSGWWVQRNAEGKVVRQWSEVGLSADDATGGVAAIFMGEATLAGSRSQRASTGALEELRGGHPQAWWKERLARLKAGAGKDTKAAALYALTLRRARVNGFVVSETPTGVELALEPAR